MVLTTRQVAEKLGISKGSVKNLIRSGKLTDLAKDKAKRHQFRIDSKEVAAFKANGIQTRVRRQPVAPNGTSEIRGGIFSRLDRIERDLKTLIDLWK